MKHTLAIFDLDGTLLNTLDDIADGVNYALRETGFAEHDTDKFKLMIGRGMTNLVTNALPEGARDEATIERVLEVFLPYYRTHAQVKTRPYPGVLDMLGALRERGVKTAILSNKVHDATVKLAEHYFPGLIDLPVGQREGVPIKPDPTSAREILTHFGAEPGQCAYIGDSGVDMRTGKAAALYTIGVTWGFRTKEELLEGGADVIIDEVSGLLPVIC